MTISCGPFIAWTDLSEPTRIIDVDDDGKIVSRPKTADDTAREWSFADVAKVRDLLEIAESADVDDEMPEPVDGDYSMFERVRRFYGRGGWYVVVEYDDSGIDPYITNFIDDQGNTVSYADRTPERDILNCWNGAGSLARMRDRLDAAEKIRAAREASR